MKLLRYLDGEKVKYIRPDLIVSIYRSMGVNTIEILLGEWSFQYYSSESVDVLSKRWVLALGIEGIQEWKRMYSDSF